MNISEQKGRFHIHRSIIESYPYLIPSLFFMLDFTPTGVLYLESFEENPAIDNSYRYTGISPRFRNSLIGGFYNLKIEFGQAQTLESSEWMASEKAYEITSADFETTSFKDSYAWGIVTHSGGPLNENDKEQFAPKPPAVGRRQRRR